MKERERMNTRQAEDCGSLWLSSTPFKLGISPEPSPEDTLRAELKTVIFPREDDFDIGPETLLGTADNDNFLIVLWRSGQVVPLELLLCHWRKDVLELTETIPVLLDTDTVPRILVHPCDPLQGVKLEKIFGLDWRKEAGKAMARRAREGAVDSCVAATITPRFK